MSTLTHGIYSMEEYLAGSTSRLGEEELVSDELYTVNFALQKRWRRKMEAARFLSRVSTVLEPDLSGRFRDIEFIVYDPGLRPAVRERSTFRDGFWQHLGSMPLQINGQNVIGGYFKEYVSDPDQELQALTQGINIPINGISAT